ncbi:MAG: hypothetical protein H6972_02155 [Gammaproteobacteria bacterium]|nr:hypothetical protein [Gammaproteobacteria bacterium]
MVTACGFSADGRWLATAGDDGAVRLWDVAGRVEAHRFGGHTGGVRACGFSPDGRWLASGGYFGGAVRLWDVAGRVEAHRFEGHAEAIWACAFSPDGRWLATGPTDGAAVDVAGGPRRTASKATREGLGLRVFAGRALAGDGGGRPDGAAVGRGGADRGAPLRRPRGRG